MGTMDVNYFVCTLGQAALPDIDRPFHDVNDLVEQQALRHPDLPAVGFYTPSNKEDTYETHLVTFQEAQNGIRVVANAIATTLTIPERQTVGLLSNSSPAFLFTWLGLIRLGHPVLLIAPQCSPSAIAHLSKACEATLLFHDRAHENLALDAVSAQNEVEFAGMRTQILPFEDDEEILRLARKQANLTLELPRLSETDVAYLHHTSGTSSGIPKPIPQTHKGGVGVLPSLDGCASATFTTTPLYHGGVADLFRAWTSAALIWLFPAQHAPITATNVLKCLDSSASVTQMKKVPSIKYFSSVPYVLQMMAQDKKGLSQLRNMDIVGVGGAALPPEVGDSLAKTGVNLVSRYGSAECGFLMSSHRDYANDKGWQYLRRIKDVQTLKFEQQADGQSELVVLSDWPHMAKRNREDGSFATSDLFAPHPDIPDAWKYHSRADSQLALITGKKFDPSPLEGSLAASSPVLSEVLIFGNGKPYPGALLFRSEEGKEKSDDDLVELIAPVVEKLNIESQSHARVPRNMLIPMPYERMPLDKSSKGTILRGQAEKKYEKHINDAYNKTSLANKNVDDKDLPNAISQIVESVVGSSQREHENLTADTDLFSFGVDSVACVQIRHALAQLLPNDAEPLPLTIVEDSGTISELSQAILRRRRGDQIDQDQDHRQLLRDMIEEYGTFNEGKRGSSHLGKSEATKNVLLTGPTGLLGAHILSQLLSHVQVNKIYLLVRGASSHPARQRVLKSLSSRMLSTPSEFDNKVVVMPCKLSETDLGLPKDDYQLLVNEIDLTLHLAWSVNFLISLRSLATTHLAGLHNLLNLTLASSRKSKFLFCSSVASVSSLQSKNAVPESIIEDFSVCGPTGYAQSKLAAELICSKCATVPSMRERITVVRVGQLSGDTEAGVWNASEAYPLMLASSKVTGVLPDLKDETLGWLPVDVAARAYLEAAFENGVNDASARTEQHLNGHDHNDTVGVLHLLNTSNATTFTDLVDAVRESDPAIHVVSVQRWLEKLAQLQEDEKTKHHPALKLLSFWKNTYGSRFPPEGSSDEKHDREDVVKIIEDSDATKGYEMTLSRSSMPSLNAATGPLKKEYLLQLWQWIKTNID